MAEQGLTSIELCAGAGGTALGLERAGFSHEALVEIDAHACDTLRHNRPGWKIVEQDLHTFDGRPYKGIDLLSAGVPCPPFSVAGKQLGADDDRDLFPEMLRIVAECRPKAVMVENVRGLMKPVFDEYRSAVDAEFRRMGYEPEWRLLKASDYGVPQLRPRVVLIALGKEYLPHFSWPKPGRKPRSVGEVLHKQMARGGWEGVDAWVSQADQIAPTLVGGSKKHGGPDLGPTRAKEAWARLGVDAKTLAEEPPGPGFDGMPRLTVPMTARLQGFPVSWRFVGRKTHAYRQVGNAFPPPVAAAVGRAIHRALVAGGALKEQSFDRRAAAQLSLPLVG